MLFKYFIVGGIGAILDLVLFYILISVFNIQWLLSNFISFSIAIFINYILCKKFIFLLSKKSKKKEIIYIYIVSIIGLFLNSLSIGLQINFLEFNILFAKVTSILITFYWNFFARKNIVFK